jgi:hypothetical protein
VPVLEVTESDRDAACHCAGRARSNYDRPSTGSEVLMRRGMRNWSGTRQGRLLRFACLVAVTSSALLVVGALAPAGDGPSSEGGVAATVGALAPRVDEADGFDYQRFGVVPLGSTTQQVAALFGAD